MTKKELEQIAKNNDKIAALRYICKELEYGSNTGSQEITGMPFAGGTSDKVGDKSVRLTDARLQLIRLVHDNELLIRRAREFIDRIPDRIIAAIIALKYIYGLDNLEIAAEVGYKGNYRDRDIRRVIDMFFLDNLLYML